MFIHFWCSAPHPPICRKRPNLVPCQEVQPHTSGYRSPWEATGVVRLLPGLDSDDAGLSRKFMKHPRIIHHLGLSLPVDKRYSMPLPSGSPPPESYSPAHPLPRASRLFSGNGDPGKGIMDGMVGQGGTFTVRFMPGIRTLQPVIHRNTVRQFLKVPETTFFPSMAPVYPHTR